MILSLCIYLLPPLISRLFEEALVFDEPKIIFLISVHAFTADAVNDDTGASTRVAFASEFSVLFARVGDELMPYEDTIHPVKTIKLNENEIKKATRFFICSGFVFKFSICLFKFMIIKLYYSFEESRSMISPSFPSKSFFFNVIFDSALGLSPASFKNVFKESLFPISP